MPSLSPRAAIALGAVSISVLAVTGCTGTEATPSGSATESICSELITFVVAVDRANQAPGVSSALAEILDRGIADGASFALIESDGTPSIVASGYRPDISNSNADAHEKDIANATKTLMNGISAMKADSDGNDTLGAVSLAADAATSSDVACNTIVVIGAGNSDRGELDVTEPGMVQASGTEVADALAARGALPRFGEVRTDVVMTGAGYTAAGSAQTPLRQADRDNLTAIYTRVFETAGASTVTDLRVPRTGNGPSTEYTVTPIPITAPTPLNLCGTTVFDNTSQLGFIEGTAKFRDPDAAGHTLSELATRLASDTRFRADIVGTTANWGSDEYQINLSTDRATTAADMLIEAGAPREQITTDGVGSEFSGYNPAELQPDGNLDPVIADTNRTVRITVAASRGGC
ncbi:OmpA family protein [Prescottella equi]|uniref:OmpA family protein n=1 Tax=Rhodococcus hoagii TaxID=43767 RepID=UPI00111C7A22|nr:OmpA family protein [Prescottella equi]